MTLGFNFFTDYRPKFKGLRLTVFCGSAASQKPADNNGNKNMRQSGLRIKLKTLWLSGAVFQGKFEILNFHIRQVQEAVNSYNVIKTV